MQDNRVAQRGARGTAGRRPAVHEAFFGLPAGHESLPQPREGQRGEPAEGRALADLGHGLVEEARSWRGVRARHGH